MSLDETTPADGDGITTGTKVSELAGAIRQLKIDLNNGGLELISDSAGATKVTINDDGSVSVYTGSTERVNIGDNGIDADVNIVSVVDVTTDCDYMDFTGLNGNNEEPYRLYLDLYNPTTSGCNYALYINTDYTATNYYSQYIVADGTTVSASRGNVATVFSLGAVTRGISIVDIKRDNAGRLRASVINNRYGGSSVQLVIRAMNAVNTYTNITSLRISASVTGGIGAGSKLILTKTRKT